MTIFTKGMGAIMKARKADKIIRQRLRRTT